MPKHQPSSNNKTQATHTTQPHTPNRPNFPEGPYPIIFIRGFAFGEDAIEATTNTPFMGFNLGSTKDRQLWTGELVRLHFASPLIRLMEDYGYQAIDIGPPPRPSTPAPPSREPSAHPQHPPHPTSPSLNPPLNPQSIIIHRYYDRADADLAAYDAQTQAPTQTQLQNDPQTQPQTHPHTQAHQPTDPPDTYPPTILEAAQDLRALIDHLHARYTQDPSPWEAHAVPFGVHLVAHSMGGLIARALLQHPDLKRSHAAKSVNRVFTYATPHGGITLAGFEIPKFLRLQHAHHFNHQHLARLFNAPSADDLNGDFPTQRFFSLIGTNHQDYGAGRGLARRLAGPMSDGLVQIKRAAVKHTPRAHIHRTHGGPFGIVNSEAGYHNLVRFLFGRLRLDAHLELHSLPLPPPLQAAKAQGHRIDASYWIEASLAPRPNPVDGDRAPVYLTERRIANHSAIFRGYDELIHPERVIDPTTNTPRPTPRHPVLFSAFLDPKRSADQTSLVLSLELKVSATDYAIDGEIHPEYSLAGQTLFQDTLKLTFSPTEPVDVFTPSSETPITNDPMAQPPIAQHPSAQQPIPWKLTVASIAEPWAQPLPIHLLPNPNTPSEGVALRFKVSLYRGPLSSSQSLQITPDSTSNEALDHTTKAADEHAFRGDLILALSDR